MEIDKEALAKYAKILSLYANLEGMRLDNLQREAKGLSPVWSSTSFFEISTELESIQKSLFENNDE